MKKTISSLVVTAVIILSATVVIFTLGHPQSAAKDYSYKGGIDCDALWQKKVDMRNGAIGRRAQILTHLASFESPKVKYDPFEPTWNCHIERRIGKEFGDGGKFVCGALDSYFSSRPCLVYSVGSHGDFTFEQAVLNDLSQDCEVHTFDPTGNSSAWEGVATASGVHFHAWGL